MKEQQGTELTKPFLSLKQIHVKQKILMESWCMSGTESFLCGWYNVNKDRIICVYPSVILMGAQKRLGRVAQVRAQPSLLPSAAAPCCCHHRASAAHLCPSLSCGLGQPEFHFWAWHSWQWWSKSQFHRAKFLFYFLCRLLRATWLFS